MTARLICLVKILILLFTSNLALAVEVLDNKSDKDTIIINTNSAGDPIISAIDSLMIIKFFETSTFTTDIDTLNTYNYDPSFVPRFPELVYECRIVEMNTKTPIELDYNEAVQRYIDVYTISRREQLSRMLGLAELYFPIFEQELDKRNLPIELKYLAIVESALNPNARSSSGAVGLWQFLYNSGKMFDLKVDSYVDERRDPYKSTKAACDYLEYLFRIFNDWQLALAAYNGGPGTVRNAIQRSGGKTGFWEIRPYLPVETQNYVPAFIAVNYAMNFATEHNIYPTAPSIFYNEIDTINITHAIYFANVSEVLNIPMETIEFLNPSYKLKYIPYSGTSVALVLPIDKIAEFIQNKDLIYAASNSSNSFEPTILEIGSTENKVKIVHTVRKGEYFHRIAIKYKCTIEDIKVWNNMPTNYIYMGKKLDIWVTNDIAKKVIDEQQQTINKTLSGDYVYYTVQKGDTLWKIANKFNCEDIVEIKELNNIENENQLHPGTKLRILSANN